MLVIRKVQEEINKTKVNVFFKNEILKNIEIKKEEFSIVNKRRPTKKRK